ncbi:hypothetical protein BD560DRAFT_424175 [Blakeslea trispora]|nr:hypothetical protein BD560DRAFT_424175 [Blakeslea trispora]
MLTSPYVERDNIADSFILKDSYRIQSCHCNKKSCFHFIVISYTSVKSSSLQRVAMNIKTFGCSYLSRECIRPFQQYMSFSILISLTLTCIIIRLDISAISYIFHFKRLSLEGIGKEEGFLVTRNGRYVILRSFIMLIWIIEFITMIDTILFLVEAYDAKRGCKPNRVKVVIESKTIKAPKF